jgi:hypothetical protein
MVVRKRSLSMKLRVKYDFAFNLSANLVVYSLVTDLKGVRHTGLIICIS